MSRPPAPNIPSAPTVHNRGRPARAPTREQLATPAATLFRKGTRSKADLWRIDLGQGPMIVKDFAGKPWWSRCVGRLLIRRECRAYRRLGSAPGFPGLVDRVDAYALALEKVEGIQLIRSPTRFKQGTNYLNAIRRSLDSLHQAGIAHLDLRGRENVVLADNGRVILLDLGGAICLRPGSLAHRLLFPLLSAADESAYLKWKEILEAGPYDARERQQLRRYRVARLLWPFRREGRPWTRKNG